jgi:hypothetical protein
VGAQLALRYEAIHTSWTAAREFWRTKFRRRILISRQRSDDVWHYAEHSAGRPETFMAALFSTDADDPFGGKILDVWICKMRKKLKPYGIEIKTRWGEC